VGLTACSNTAAPAAAPASHGATSVARTPVSCGQQYTTWMHQHGKGLIAALGAVSSAETAGDARVLTITLRRAPPAAARGTPHPPRPACAHPRGYWAVLLTPVSAAAAASPPPPPVRAAIKDVPKIQRQLTAELKQTTQ